MASSFFFFSDLIYTWQFSKFSKFHSPVSNERKRRKRIHCYKIPINKVPSTLLFWHLGMSPTLMGHQYKLRATCNCIVFINGQTISMSASLQTSLTFSSMIHLYSSSTWIRYMPIKALSLPVIKWIITFDGQKKGKWESNWRPKHPRTPTLNTYILNLCNNPNKN